MIISPASRVSEFYDASADAYAQEMDTEIDLPIYSDTLGRLAERISDLPGPILDTSCGPGHMLSRYHERYDPDRPLLGVDLSPSMVSLAKNRLGAQGDVLAGDMRDLGQLESLSSAALLSFFALHHLDPAEIVPALQEWRRVLCPRGQLVLATWEGSGPIDYGEKSDIVALRYSESEICGWARTVGFAVDRVTIESFEGFEMQAVFLEGTRA